MSNDVNKTTNNTKSGKDWDDLTDDLKKKCIESMDFKTRYRLRSSSKTERNLVDSRKLHLRRVVVKTGFGFDSIILKPEIGPSFLKCTNSSSTFKQLTPLIEYVLKHGKIDSLEVKIGKSDEKIEKRVLKRLIEASEAIDLTNWKPRSNPKNWNDLSESLKKKCIDWMTFKTRLSLRKTCKTERNLVDSHRFHFDLVKIDEDARSCYDKCIEVSFRTIFHRDFFFKYRKQEDFLKKAVPFLTYILKVGNISTFDCEIGDDFMKEMMETIKRENDKYRIRKYVNFTSLGLKGTQLLLENCEMGLEKILCNPIDCEESDLKRLVALPVVAKAKDVLLWNVSCPSAVIDLLEKWIENDAEINTKMEFMATISTKMQFLEPKHEFLNAFHSKFRDRIVYNNNSDNVKIQMDNPDKLISMKAEGFLAAKFKLRVISSDFIKMPYEFTETDESSVASSNEATDYDRDFNVEDDDEIYVPPV